MGADFRLVRVDDFARRVLGIGELHRRIGGWAPARGGIGAGLREPGKEGAQLRTHIARMPRADFVPQAPIGSRDFTHPSRDQLVLGGEVPVQAHFGGIRLLGDGFDPDCLDALAIEQVARSLENPVAGAQQLGYGTITLGRGIRRIFLFSHLVNLLLLAESNTA
ncbi:MAG: hypothetical protein WDN04_16375 [Rhodospirillales bacterium]